MAVPAAGDLAAPHPPLLLVLLADGRLHSGEWLAQELNVSRAAIWRGVDRLRGLGLTVQALPRRGYRLAQPVELLDARQIRAELQPPQISRLHALELLFEVDSTNSRLLAAPPPPTDRADACLSELQLAGRGRRGRRWITPFGSGVALSVSYVFGDGARTLPGLSLAVGVAAARAMRRASLYGVSLKWPNDILLGGRKLGGVLIELRAEAGGPAHVVVGVGLNVVLTDAARRDIEAKGARVAAAADCGSAVPSRNFVAGAILDEVLRMLGEFEREGFAAFRDEWAALDALNGRAARVLIADAAISGTARGVDAQGALLLETGNELRRFVSGEVTLRVDEDDV